MCYHIRPCWYSFSSTEPEQGPSCPGENKKKTIFIKLFVCCVLRVYMNVCVLLHVYAKPKGPRAQIDRTIYKREMQRELQSIQNLTILESSVEDLRIDNGAVSGVVLGIAAG